MNLKKLYDFAVACVYVLGSIGGFGYAMYNKAYLIGVCVACVAAMAYPYVREAVKDLLA